MNVDKYNAAANKLIRNPDDAIALIDQFSNISERKTFEKRQNSAYLYYYLARRAWLNNKTDINTVFNYGSACHRTGKFQDALELYRNALNRAPTKEWKATCLHHVGIAYRALGRNKEAAKYYEAANELIPDPRIMRDRALAILASGDLQAGFEAFEVRKEAAEEKFIKNGVLKAQAQLPTHVTQWDGEFLNGKDITVYHEEGSGDFIQFSRYIPKLDHLGAGKIYLTGKVPDLLHYVGPQLGVVHGVVDFNDIPTELVVGSMSVPHLVGIDYKEVSGERYFDAEPFPLFERGKLSVGLVWRGNPDYGMDVHRSMPFCEFAPLFDLPGVAFYSLQCGPAKLEVHQLGLDGFVTDLEPVLKTWADTAGVIQALDLVVSVDTAVAHLAGALGKTVWTLTTAACDWRWPRSGEKTPWYDSMRIIRQDKQDDWTTSIKKVKRKIEGILSERGSDTRRAPIRAASGRFAEQ